MNIDIIMRAKRRYRTPFYLFDENALLETICRVASGLPSNVELCYAMKANPFVVGVIANKVSRIEACSPGELHICQMAQIHMERIVVSGVHKDVGLMLDLVAGEARVCRYTIESVAQYRMLEQMAQAKEARLPILLRLSSGNQFGLDSVDFGMLVEDALRNPFFQLCGVQYFSGTQKTSSKRISRELSKLDAVMDRVAGCQTNQGEELELEYGPGLPIAYFEHDERVARNQEEAQLLALAEALQHMRFSGRVVLELGRALVADCGAYVTGIVDTKTNGGRNYAIVDGGMHQLAYYGHGMALQQPICSILPPRERARDEAWNVCGSLCTTNDVLAKQLPLSDVKVGDLLAFGRAGAYGMTEGMSLFLSRDLPRILLATSGGTVRQLRDRVETYTLNAPAICP